MMNYNIGIKHGFPCMVPKEMLKTKAIGRGFQHLPRDLANVNVLENNVRLLLLHKFKEILFKIWENYSTIFCHHLAVIMGKHSIF